MLTHAEIYRRVCEARPECVVNSSTVKGASLSWHGPTDEYGNEREPHEIGWGIGDDVFDATLCGGDDAPIAIGLIVDLWLKNLKQGESLCFASDGWAVWGTRDGINMLDPGSADPFHALAEHFAPGSTKEKA